MEDVKMIYVTGQSGKKYRFYSFHTSDHFKKAAGVYILTNRLQERNKTIHRVLQIGETDDLSILRDRIHSNELDCKSKANCVCARMVDDMNERMATFRDIKLRYKA